MQCLVMCGFVNPLSLSPNLFFTDLHLATEKKGRKKGDKERRQNISIEITRKQVQI